MLRVGVQATWISERHSNSSSDTHTGSNPKHALSCASRVVRPTEVGENAYTQYQALRKPNPCDLPDERPSAARQEREAFLQS